MVQWSPDGSVINARFPSLEAIVMTEREERIEQLRGKVRDAEEGIAKIEEQIALSAEVDRLWAEIEGIRKRQLWSIDRVPRLTSGSKTKPTYAVAFNLASLTLPVWLEDHRADVERARAELKQLEADAVEV